MSRRAWVALALGAMLLDSSQAAAEVDSVVVERREDVLGGRPFGAAGPYEKIVGRVYFSFDPASPANAAIADLERAPRNARGRVEAWANFVVLRPRNPVPGGGTALLEVSNRGGKASLVYFNGGRGSLDPTAEEEFGDGWLMRRGLTVVWVGWQHDVPLAEGLLRLHVPVATDEGAPIEGLVRADWTVDEPARTLALGHRNHVAYPVSDAEHPDNVLTARYGRLAPRRVVPRGHWRFAREEDGRAVEDRTHIYAEAGFEAGRIYELVYRARDPKVVGLGLAAVRDMIAYAKHDPQSPFPVRHGIAVGISQTGRFLRHFLYQGFNTDEHGRAALDGMMVLTAGAGRGSFNHRFAQPSRDAHRYSAFFYPTDLFPFTSREQTDPETGRRDGLLTHALNPDHRPKIFYLNTGYEYWGRAASLIHTSVDGRADVEPYPNERIYHLSSMQHFPGRWPPRAQDRMPGSSAYRGNPIRLDYARRALLRRLVDWVRDGREPPASAYPRIDAGTLVPVEGLVFPAIPGVAAPRAAHEAYRADYGPRWEEGIIDRQPPALGPAFPALVPQVDSLGNERAGLRGIAVRVPLATYAPWNLRIGFPGATDELTDFLGTFIPLPRTEADRRRTGDPRPSVERLYAGRDAYVRELRRAAAALVEEGFLLDEDAESAVAHAARVWDWIHRN